MNNYKIAPSILCADFANFGKECEAIEKQGCERIWTKNLYR